MSTEALMAIYNHGIVMLINIIRWKFILQQLLSMRLHVVFSTSTHGYCAPW